MVVDQIELLIGENMKYNFPPFQMQQKKPFGFLSYKGSQEQNMPPKVSKKIKNSNSIPEQNDPLYKILSWRDSVQTRTMPPEKSYSMRKTSSIVDDDESKWGSKFQGIFVDVDWQSLPMQQFKKLKFDDQLIDNGIVFIWMPRDQIGELMDYFIDRGFVYVENFIFALLDRNKIPDKKKIPSPQNTLDRFLIKRTKETEEEQSNKPPTKQQPKDYEIGKVDDPKQIFVNQSSNYLLGSQKILFLFRKLKKNQALELRHQRTSDAFFTIGDGNKLDWKSKQMVYQMIQTLLIKANYAKNQPLKLLELWGNSEYPRKGWASVCEEKEQ